MMGRLTAVLTLGCCFFAASCMSSAAPKPPAEPAEDADQQDWTGVMSDFSISSTPSGAAVKLSSGEKCKTPCSVQRPITENFDVALSKNGFRSKTVSVISHQNVLPGSGGAGKPKLGKPQLSPNPVSVTLEPVWDR